MFDEVHFGKFAGYYIKGTYYFDVHPPLAKLVFAAVAYVCGYDGNFPFKHIHDEYVVHGLLFYHN